MIDPNKQSITFSQPGDQLVYFKIKTGSKTGKVTMHITASGGSQQAKETIEIEVRNPNPAVTFRNSQWVEKGEITLRAVPLDNVAEEEAGIDKEPYAAGSLTYSFGRYQPQVRLPV